jgi:DNA polymerase
MTTSAATLLIESHKQWWEQAGLEALVDEAPVNWLAPPKVSDTPPAQMASETAVRAAEHWVAGTAAHLQPAAVAPAAPTPSVDPVAMPGDWTGFQTWLAQDAAVPGTRWHPHRVLPAGPVAAPLMVLALTPEMADHDAGSLFSGDCGRLLDAMLRAIGLTRGACYLSSLALTRPPGGRLDASDLTALTPLLWHHLEMARPERLLLLGTDLTQIATGIELAAARGRLLDVNHHGITMQAAAIQHPMLLLDRPARKAAAWDSLKLLKR